MTRATPLDVSIAVGPADRRVHSSGAVEQVGYLGRAERIFSCLHLPAGEPRGAVVICSSIMSELLANYTNETGLARMLADRGFAVRRFHYRGAGHSDGNWTDVDFERLLEDATTVAERLADETGSSTIGFLGSRFGSLVAAAAVARYPEAPLALWEPFSDGRRFFQELFRYKRIIGVRSSDTLSRTFDAFLEEARTAPVDFAGYLVRASLFESAASVRLASEMRAGHPVLVVGFGSRPKDRLRPEEVAAQMAEAGARVDLRFVDQQMHWLFHRPDLMSVGKVASVTADWFDTLTGGSA
jgi:pimeloyl-ACP methyl ester carboxylesterase